MGGDDHVAFGLAVVADALQAVHLGQLVDDLAVFPVHGRETVALLWLLSLEFTSATVSHLRRQTLKYQPLLKIKHVTYHKRLMKKKKKLRNYLKKNQNKNNKNVSS